MAASVRVRACVCTYAVFCFTDARNRYQTERLKSQYKVVEYENLTKKKPVTLRVLIHEDR